MSVKINDRYGKLLVLELIPHSKNPRARCLCDCGKEAMPQRGSLMNGRATSCGCRRNEVLRTVAITHGESSSSTYKTYRAMLSRCNDQKNKAYKNYGARGIKVLWNSFEEFYADMGERPDGYWIDRLNNDGHYEKSNCEWVPPQVNQQNKRTSKIWVVDKVEYSSSKEASAFLGIDTSQVNRNCNGYIKNGKHYPPKDGWSSHLKYA